MPELPEVENVCRTLQGQLAEGSSLNEIHFYRKDLRFPLPEEIKRNLLGATFESMSRRGKYLLFFFDRGVLLSHLGMTGHWRTTEEKPVLEKHDHVVLRFSPGPYLIYNDSRRFGFLLFVKNREELNEHPRLRHLGKEPLGSGFNAEYLQGLSRGVSRIVKVFLMDQAVVVGIGNIYASEVLFRANVRPNRKASGLKLAEWGSIVMSVREVLGEAIASGGSTIRDYRNADGNRGGFQNQHRVYGREGEPCFVCGTPIKSKVFGGRSTYWCPKCQR